jgi:hypothetical protein
MHFSYLILLLSGTSHGTVLVLTEVTVSGELSSPNPPSPVCDVKCSESGHVVVSDEGGLINLWQPNHQENIVFGWKGSGSVQGLCVVVVGVVVCKVCV